MALSPMSFRLLPALFALGTALWPALVSRAAEPGLLFYLSGDQGTTADFSAANTAKPTYDSEVGPIPDGARAGALECGNYQVLAYRAPGNIYAQRGTLSLFWRARYPVGPTAFPIFRVGYADHSSWDMVFLRIDYNGHGFDAFVTDASLARTRVSVSVQPFPDPKTWTHLAVAWDENRGLRFYINGKLAAHVETKARYDAALDQFGPHSRIISPHQVQSDYNFVRGGDIDEVRIYDRMLDDTAIATLAKVGNNTGLAVANRESEPGPIGPNAPRTAPNDNASALSRSLADAAVRNEWYFRYGWNRRSDPPPYYAGAKIGVRKVEIHDAYDMKRWWWKANDGIRETTWPGVYNRSRLPGRNDYFQLPDWDCYVEAGKAVTFALPAEPWNHVEISGAAYGKMEALPPGTTNETAYLTNAETTLFERPQAQEKTVHRLKTPRNGGKIRFTNVTPEQPIGELVAYHVSAMAEPAGSAKRTYRIASSAESDSPTVGTLKTFIAGRFLRDEASTVVASPASARAPLAPRPSSPPKDASSRLPLVHVLIADDWDELGDGLDGIAIDLPALKAKPTHGEYLAWNVQIKDPLWPLRNMLDFTFSVKPGEAKSLWLDLRDRLLPKNKGLWISIASSSADFNATHLDGAEVRLVFKPGEAARAEHESDRFTQVRDVYGMMTEEHPMNSRLDMWNRFKGDLEDLLRVNPDHALGRQYAAAGIPGSARPSIELAPPPDGVPLWAFRQVTCLEEVKRFVMWYIEHRQVAYGDFGGGISDDVDLVNTWPGVALMGVEPDTLKASAAALLDAAYKNGMFANGLPAIQADELHSYEEGINCLGQNLILDFGSPRQLERAMETARGIESITGINGAGHRHIRTSYYSGTKMAEEEPWGYAKPYSYLVLQVPQLLVDFNGNPAAKKYLVELADGLLAHHHGAGRPGVPAIRFSDDHEAEVGRGYFPWHVFWAAYRFTGDRKYLTPVLDGGITSLVSLTPNVLDLLQLREDWGARLGAGERAAAIEGRRDAGRTRERTSGYRASSNEHFSWQLTGDKSHLERLYAQQIETCKTLEYINTEGSLWIDRVGVPFAELQRARLGGVALVRSAVFPGHVISWRFTAPATERSVAILVPNATRTEFKVIAYNLEQTPVHATITGWNVDPGTWEVVQGVDTNDDDVADGESTARSVAFERSRSMEVTLPPRATTILSFKLKAPGTPYWQRPDLGIDPSDITVARRKVRVRLHSLGSIDAPATTVALRNATGKIVASATVPMIPAPNDLKPKTTEVTLTAPLGTALNGATVEIDPDHRLEEITTMNNVVKLRL